MPRKKTSRRSRATPELPAKRVVAGLIGDILSKRGLTQTEAARIVRDAPSQLSLIVNGHLRGFSLDRLLRIVTRLGHDVAIEVRPGSRKRISVRVVGG